MHTDSATRQADPSNESLRDELARSGLKWEFAQQWLPRTDPDFTPGTVYLGRCDDELLVRADLVSNNVMTGVFPLNYPAFRECDAFEIFLSPEEEPSSQFHVTPSNSRLQLHFDGFGPRHELEKHHVHQPVFTSSTSITPDGWSAFARVPLLALFPRSGAEWLFSFGRYDYLPGRTRPVASSTSPHSRFDFHCKPEWRRVLDSLPAMASR